MIIRVFRARVREGSEADFQEKVNLLSIPLVKGQKGMIEYYAGRSMGSPSNEFLMVTVWEDLASLKAFAGADWNRVVVPEEELPLLEGTSVDHYEIFGSSSSIAEP